MNLEIWEALLWGAAGGLGVNAVFLLNSYLAKRRRRKSKPWRISAEPPKLPVAGQRKTKASMGKAPVRKTKARIGVHRRLNR